MIKYRLHHNRKKKLKQDGTAVVQIEIYKGNTRGSVASVKQDSKILPNGHF